MSDNDRPANAKETEVPPMLGDKVKDRITGFTGIAYGIANWMTGSQQIYVVPTLDEHGNLRPMALIDIDRLEVVERGTVVIPTVTKTNERPLPPSRGTGP